MAGTIKVDQVQSDSNLSFNLAGSNVAYLNATSLQLVSSNISVAGSNIVTNGRVVASAQPTGAVLQVVSAIKTDTFSFSVTARTWTSVTGLSASITPSSTSNKVLVTAVVSISATNTYNAMGGRITRNGTAVAVGNTVGSSRQFAFFGSDDWLGAASANQGQIFISFLDSPSTTSSVTYQLQLINDRDTETIYVNSGAVDPDSSQEFRNASSITVMEIAG
jgi:hypothetical protein